MGKRSNKPDETFQEAFEFVWPAPKKNSDSKPVAPNVVGSIAKRTASTATIQARSPTGAPQHTVEYARRCNLWAFRASLLIFLCGYFALAAKIGLSTGPQIPFPVSAVTVFDKGVLPGALGLLVLILTISVVGLKSFAFAIDSDQSESSAIVPAALVTAAFVYWSIVAIVPLTIVYTLASDIRDFLFYLFALITYDPTAWPAHTTVL